MSEIMRKNLARVYVCFRTESLHLPPDVGSADWLSGSCYEHTSFGNFLLRYIPQQFLAEFLRQKDRPCLALHRNDRIPVFYRFHRYKLKFADADSRAADRLQDQTEPFIMLLLGRTASRSYSVRVSSLRTTPLPCVTAHIHHRLGSCTRCASSGYNRLLIFISPLSA